LSPARPNNVPAMHEGKSISAITNDDLRSVDQREAAEAMRAKCEAVAREYDHFEIGKKIADAIAALKGRSSMSEDDLINEIALLFGDAMMVRCEPSSYAKSVIAKVRAFDALAWAERDKRLREAMVRLDGES
jgi:hypothetical protein